MIADMSNGKNISQDEGGVSFLLAMTPPSQGLSPFLALRQALPWTPFRHALPPLVPLCSLARPPSREDLRRIRLALRGGFSLTGVFSLNGDSWLRIDDEKKPKDALAILFSRPEALQIEGILPAAAAVYLGSGELPQSQIFSPWRQDAWRLCLYKIIPLYPEARRGFLWELPYDRPIPKTSAQAEASQASLNNL
jgi:hypothetical protein